MRGAALAALRSGCLARRGEFAARSRRSQLLRVRRLMQGACTPARSNARRTASTCGPRRRRMAVRRARRRRRCAGCRTRAMRRMPGHQRALVPRAATLMRWGGWRRSVPSTARCSRDDADALRVPADQSARLRAAPSALVARQADVPADRAHQRRAGAQLGRAVAVRRPAALGGAGGVVRDGGGDGAGWAGRARNGR